MQRGRGRRGRPASPLQAHLPRISRASPLQVQLLRLLPLLASHVLAASLAMHVSREMDACRLLLLGTLVALADVLSRAPASDCVGVFAEHYSGRAFPKPHGGSAFGFGASQFAAETDSLKFVTPDLVVVRDLPNSPQSSRPPRPRRSRPPLCLDLAGARSVARVLRVRRTPGPCRAMGV